MWEEISGGLFSFSLGGAPGMSPRQGPVWKKWLFLARVTRMKLGERGRGRIAERRRIKKKVPLILRMNPQKTQAHSWAAYAWDRPKASPTLRTGLRFKLPPKSQTDHGVADVWDRPKRASQKLWKLKWDNYIPQRARKNLSCKVDWADCLLTQNSTFSRGSNIILNPGYV